MIDKKRAADAAADEARTHDFFMQVSGGAKNLMMDQYLVFFGYDSNSADCPRKQPAVSKFHMHDLNGDGLLKIHEIKVLM